MTFDPILHKNISGAIDKDRFSLSIKVVERQYELFPESLSRYGERGKLKGVEDAEYSIKYLAEAIALGDVQLFINYILWLNGVLAGVKVPTTILVDHLTILKQELRNSLPHGYSSISDTYLDHALHVLECR